MADDHHVKRAKAAMNSQRAAETAVWKDRVEAGRQAKQQTLQPQQAQASTGGTPRDRHRQRQAM
jgi:hypothetical protein